MRSFKILFSVAVLTFISLITLLMGITVYKYTRLHDFYFDFEDEGKLDFLPEEFIPTGYSSAPDGELIVGKMGDDGAARVYLIKESGEVSYIPLFDKYNSALRGDIGGVSFFDKYIYIGRDNYILVYYYEDLIDGIDDAVCYEEINTYTKASYCTVSGDFLYVGSYSGNDGRVGGIIDSELKDGSLITVFRLTKDKGVGAKRGIFPTPICAVSTRNFVRGIAVVDINKIALSVSCGRSLSTLEFHVMDTERRSEILLSDGNKDFKVPLIYLDNSTKTGELTCPPNQEEIFEKDKRIYILNTSIKKSDALSRFFDADRRYSLSFRDDYFIKD